MIKHINVLGQKVRICYDDNDLKKDELGVFDATGMSIHIREGLKDHPLHNSVLIHEICHAIIHISGNSNLLGNGVEESLCIALEYGLRPFIKDKLL